MHPYTPPDPFAPKSTEDKRLQRQAIAYCLKVYAMGFLVGVLVFWLLFH